MLGIIIPTKDNITEMVECLKSIKKHTFSKYRVYVADTGSVDEIKHEIENTMNSLFKDNSKFIEYDYYNFSKINNDVVRNHIDDDIDVLVFCNNDIKIGVTGLLDVMSNTLMDNKDTIGTCGCRLLDFDHNIRHDGQIIASNIDSALVLSHRNLTRFDKDITSPKTMPVDGNTFALCATLRSTFEYIGMLSEEYVHCFEDVQYNIDCMGCGLINMLIPSKYWAYHHESITRGPTDVISGRERCDYIRVNEYVADNPKLKIRPVVLEDYGNVDL